MSNLKVIRSDFHAKFLDCRSIDTLIHSDSFEMAYNEASESVKKTLSDAIRDLNRTAIKQFLDNWAQGTGPFEQMSVRKLRTIGQHLRIPNYHLLNKIDLIKEIKNEVQRVKELTERILSKSKLEGTGSVKVHSGCG